MPGILRTFRSPLFTLFGVWLCYGSSVAQHVRIEPGPAATGGRSYTVVAEWDRSLRQTVDSSSTGTLDLQLLRAAGAGAFETSEVIPLPSPVSPRVQVTASDFEEVAVSPGTTPDSLLARLAGPVASVLAPGIERKKPVGTLSVRLLSYDAERQVLRRYRRLVVQVTYAATSDASMRRTTGAASNPHVAVTRSVLADGLVFRIPIEQEGIYRIDRNYLDALLKSAGTSLSAVQPGNIRVYGNGGAPLPALNSDPRIPDLREVPVSMRMDGSSFAELVFYAEGPYGWNYDAQRSEWRHYINPFTTHTAYFLKIDPASSEGRRVAQAPWPGLAGPEALSTVTGRFFAEPERVLWAREAEGGLNWVGNLFRSGSKFAFARTDEIPGFTPGPTTLRARVAVKSNPGATARLLAGGAVMDTRLASPTGNNSDDPVAYPVEVRAMPQNLGAVELAVDLTGGGSNPEAALDWAEVFYRQRLTPTSGVLRFVLPAGRPDQQPVLSGFTSAPVVWDVTDPANITGLTVQSSGSDFLIQVPAGNAPRELIAFSSSGIQPAPAAARVAAQNLHGIAGFPAMVIVAPDTFRTVADEIATMRRAEGLETIVVDIAEIYNEFGGGVTDMRALRDYFKFLYDRASDDGGLPQYALLLGDGHYDFRGISNPPFRNWIPSYQTDESLNTERAYTSDDYFGLLDDNEGVWSYVGTEFVTFERVDLGIGRFTVQTPAEAAALVDKIKMYQDATTLGEWRSRYLFVADDEFNGRAHINADNDLHVQNAEAVTRDIERQAPFVTLEKVYLMAYEPVYTTEWRVPQARADILTALNEGVLLFNYTGHGNEHALAQEDIFNRSDAAELNNSRTPTIFVTVTCSFGRWDMTDDQSGAEALILNPDGGAVGLFTTVRTVYTSTNINSLNVGLNRALNNEFFRLDAEGKPRRLGDIMRSTKGTSAGLQSNSRKFTFIGDPSMRIGLPAPAATVTRMNGKALTDSTLRFSAMDQVTLEGVVPGAVGSPDETFDGTARLTVYDAEREVRLRAPRYLDAFNLRDGMLWRGDVAVRDGRFAATFIVPRDISFSDRPARIAVYAHSGYRHVAGADESVRVGGTSTNPPDDKLGPKLSLYLNDTTFVDGGLTGNDPMLIVRLSDQSGVNTVASGVGHELLLTVDGQEQNAINIGPFYQSDEDSYQQGSVRFPLSQIAGADGRRGLEPGAHQLRVKAWDVLNNPSTAEISFVVTGSDALTLRNVFNYPNPMSGATRFAFEHNQPSGTPARIQIRIFSLSGRPVRTIDTDEALPSGVLAAGVVQIPWDGRDQDFDPLGTGVYLYRLRVEVDDPDGNRQVAEKIEKIAVIR